MKITSYLRKFVPAFVAISMVLIPLTSVLADQTFYFTDDLSNAYYLDASQNTNIQNVNGSAYLVVGALNGSLTSTVVNTAQGQITNAVITAQYSSPVGSFINFYISNDNGANWYPVGPSVNFEFPHPGSQLRWRAYIARSILDYQPYLDSITINYTISGDANTPTQYGWQDQSQNLILNSGIVAGISDPEALVCNTLSMIGLGCGSYSQTTSYQPTTKPLNFSPFGYTSTNTSSGMPYVGAKDLSDNSINLVQVPGSPDIYELTQGFKHLIPNPTIFADYGWTTDMVQTITQAQLDKYPRAYILKVHGDTKHTYYFTDGGLVRPIINDTVLNSYGDRKEDVIEISQKEFNFYPVNQYVFLETPLNRDVFQLTSEGKRYLTPMAVQRIGITDSQIVPVNQTELDAYKTLAPVVN